MEERCKIELARVLERGVDINARDGDGRRRWRG